MMIEYPIDCIMNEDCLEFLYCAQEKLRLEHNKNSKAYAEKKITVKQWRVYLKEEFEPKSKKIGYNIALLRKKLGWDTTVPGDIKAEEYSQKKESYKQSTRWDPELDKI